MMAPEREEAKAGAAEKEEEGEEQGTPAGSQSRLEVEQVAHQLPRRSRRIGELVLDLP